MSQQDNDESHRQRIVDAIDQYEPRLVRYVSRMLYGDSERARDVVQQAFLKLCQQDTEPIKDRIGPWLFTVCRNQVLDESQKRSATEMNGRSESKLSNEKSPDEIVAQLDLQKLVQSQVDELPEAQRNVIELWSHGLSYREIGEVLEKKENAARVTLHRAIQTIKKHPAIREWLHDIDPQSMTAKTS